MNYCDKTDVQNYTLKTIATSFDDQLDLWIGAMSRFADTHCGRTLVQDTPDTRLYDGNGTCELAIDSVVSITEVTVDDVVVEPYQYPANKSVKDLLVFDGDYFTEGYQNVQVTGKFALFADEVPDDIRFAVAVLVAGIINAEEEGVQSEKLGPSYSVAYTTPEERLNFKRAMQILNGYRRIGF